MNEKLLKLQVSEIPSVESCVNVIPTRCAKHSVEQSWMLDKNTFVLYKVHFNSFTFLKIKRCQCAHMTT